MKEECTDAVMMSNGLCSENNSMSNISHISLQKSLSFNMCVSFGHLAGSALSFQVVTFAVYSLFPCILDQSVYCIVKLSYIDAICSGKSMAVASRDPQAQRLRDS